METYQTSPDADKNEMIMKRMIRSMVNTCMPGIIQEFDYDTQTATIQPAIRSIITIDQEKQGTSPLPQLINVPILIPHGKTNGFSITYPIEKGDECLVWFSQRSIDNWYEKGAVADPVETTVPRSFDLSDGMAFVGLNSSQNRISAWQNDTIELRNSDGSTRVSVYDEKIEIEDISGSKITMEDDGTIIIQPAVKTIHDGDLELTGDLTHTGNVTQTGDITSTGTIQALVDVKTSVVSLGLHQHTSATPGSPTSPPLPS